MPLTPTQKKAVRQSIAAYCAAGRSNEPHIHYAQTRPFPLIDRIDVGWHTLDCSGFAINTFWNAGHDCEVYLADPSGQRYSGNGNTWTMEAWLRDHGGRVTVQPYLVGDVALYRGHVIVCSSRGGKKSSRWTSHGSEGGPLEVRVGYRDDLVGVWRHPALL